MKVKKKEEKRRTEKKRKEGEGCGVRQLLFSFLPFSPVDKIKKATGTDEEGGNVEEILVRHSLVKADADGLVVDAPQVDALADTLKKKKEDKA